MNALRRRIVFATSQPSRGPLLSITDLLIILIIAVAVYIGVRLAVASPQVLNGPQINLSPRALPYYALLSLGRMSAAYLLSIIFSLIYGYSAASNPAAERVLLPILDVLQSVPILSFLPVVLLGLTAILPQGLAVEIAAVVLIFTSQAWNLTYSFYQSMKTLPKELREASAVFRFNWWWRFRRMELPFAAIGLLWNSVMSWAGGWFFLMAAETFTVGDRDFRLPGLGSYLQRAASANDTTAIIWGIATLVLVVVAYGCFRLSQLLISVSWVDYSRIAVGTLTTALRVVVSLVIAVLWTVPLGVAIGSSARLATILQPLVQIVASIPATALFPVILLALVSLPGGLNIAAILLMLLGTQWYVLFNVIAGTTAIPQDLRYTTDLLRFSTVNRWRKLILPALFPYLVTGLITAGGGAWNASIVAEYTTFNNKTYSVTGLGSLITEATANVNFPLR